MTDTELLRVLLQGFYIEHNGHLAWIYRYGITLGECKLFGGGVAEALVQRKKEFDEDKD